MRLETLQLIKVSLVKAQCTC